MYVFFFRLTRQLHMLHENTSMVEIVGKFFKIVVMFFVHFYGFLALFLCGSVHHFFCIWMYHFQLNGLELGLETLGARFHFWQVWVGVCVWQIINTQQARLWSHVYMRVCSKSDVGRDEVQNSSDARGRVDSEMRDLGCKARVSIK